MPRIARIKEEFGTYHIIVRGNEKKDIFKNNGDKKMYLDIIARMKKKYNFLIYSYCIMDNHAHLIINDNGNDISQIMKSIGVSYAILYNRKYKRVGHLFQGRFKSHLIDSDRYLLEVSKYIHNNPVKAGITADPKDYPWSSYLFIIGRNKENQLVEQDVILNIISNKKAYAIREYKKYVLQKDEIENVKMLTEDGLIELVKENREIITKKSQAQNKIREMAKEMGLSFDELLKNKEIRNEVIKKLRENSTLTLKVIGEIVGGLSESQVSRILRNG